MYIRRKAKPYETTRPCYAYNARAARHQPPHVVDRCKLTCPSSTGQSHTSIICLGIFYPAAIRDSSNFLYADLPPLHPSFPHCTFAVHVPPP